MRDRLARVLFRMLFILPCMWYSEGAVPPMACCTSYGLLYLLWVAVGGAAPSPHHTHVSVSPLSGTAGALYLLWHAVPPMSCCRRCGALAAPAASLSFSFEWYSEGAVPPMACCTSVSSCRRCGALAAPAARLSFFLEWYSGGAVPPMSSQAGSRTPPGLWVVVD